MKTVIIGKGKVGEATAASLRQTEVTFHDPWKGLVVNDFSPFDYAIVCVDTLREGPYDHATVIRVLHMLAAEQYKGVVLIRSTVNPEIVSMFKTTFGNLRIVMFPEFMRQTDDLKMDDPWIVVLGGDVTDVLSTKWFLFENEYCSDADKYLLCSHAEASIIKMCQNAGLATRVIFFNMVSALCEKYQGRYSVVRQGVGADKRVGLEYSIVPSPDDGMRGFKGHCLPKDVASLATIDDFGFFEKLLEINKRLGR